MLSRIAISVLLLAAITPTGAQLTDTAPVAKLDPLARGNLADIGYSRVVVRAVDNASASALVRVVMNAGGTVRRSLRLIDALAADVPNTSLVTIAASPLVARVSIDRRTTGAMERTGATVGANTIHQALGYDGSGVGIAVIDSGVTAWHDDLAAQSGGQRVDRFVDFVNGWTAPYDDYGHGTHVAGIIAGDGFDSAGARTGIAPRARLTVLKVLNGSGSGYISDVIAALDYAVEHRAALNLRVVNLSVAAGVHESYNTDPLTLAARRAVEAGLILVAAAGNGGRNPDGRNAYGGITAPGNAPWVLTVGASSHEGTFDRADDTMGRFSSRGPTRIDHAAKPDLVAPGVGIESLSDPHSTYYTTKSAYLLPGTTPMSYLPYLSLTGTSMATPVVTGTVALMLQANPSLTPNLVKAILQYTATVHSGYDPLTQGAGFLNARGAVQLAHYLATPSAAESPDASGWSRRVIWGNRMVRSGTIPQGSNAWSVDVMWGRPTTPSGEPVEMVSDEGSSANVVWGTLCEGADCTGDWTVEAVDDDQSVVWGTDDPDQSVVWGTDEDDGSVVWGTECSDSACEPVIWPAP